MATKAEHIFVEVNHNIPCALGGNSEKIHISEVTFVIEGENTPLAELPTVEPTDVDRKIAPMFWNTCGMVSASSWVSVPCQHSGKMICDTDLKDLGGWTEMLVDSYQELWESGKMTGIKKNIDPGKINYTFALGGKNCMTGSTIITASLPAA
jgi:acyl-CoA hydrolase